MRRTRIEARRRPIANLSRGVVAWVGLALGALAWVWTIALAPLAVAEEGEAVHLDVELGVQGLSLDGTRNARVFLDRDVSDDAFVHSFGLHWSGFGNGWVLNAAGRNVLRLDQRYWATLDKPGFLRLRAGWVEIPHAYSNRSTWLLGGTDGYSLQNEFRQELETAATDPAAPTPIEVLVPQVLESSARPVDLRVERERADGEATVRLARGLEVDATVAYVKREGEREVGTGTYIRRQAVAGEPSSGPGFFDRERFEPRGLELLEPVHWRVNDYGASAGFHRKQGHVTVGWQGSYFRNRAGELLWDNPFEAAPSVASASDRGRFAQGGLDLYPENDFNRVYASGGFNLPRRTRVNANLAWGMWKQDDPFMAFTRNEALLFPGPDGTPGTTDDVPGTSLSLLPAASLDGEIRTTNLGARVHSRPVPAVSVHAEFRNYKYEDKTSELEFPGYAGFSESAFRRGIGQKRDGQDVLFNKVGGYERRALSGGVGYRIVPRAGVEIAYANTRWEYDVRQVESTTEDSWRGTVRLEPTAGVGAHVTYINNKRDFEGDYEIGFETSRIRAFDVWERDRDRLQAGVDWAPDERWSVAVDFAGWKDEYPGVVQDPDPLPSTGNIFPSFPYGLNEAKTLSVSGLVSYHVDRWSLSAGYGHDANELTSLSVTKTSLADDAVQYDPTNRWERVQDDDVDWASLGFTLELVPDRVQLSADLGWSHYEGKLATSNPATPVVNSAVAYEFPDFVSDFFTGKLGVRWNVHEHLDVVARYWAEPYRLGDFQWDNVQPYMQGVVKETGSAPDVVRDATVERLLLADSRYSNYTVHAIAVGVATHF